jgi:hypothetical protein
VQYKFIMPAHTTGYTRKDTSAYNLDSHIASQFALNVFSGFSGLQEAFGICSEPADAFFFAGGLAVAIALLRLALGGGADVA